MIKFRAYLKERPYLKGTGIIIDVQEINYKYEEIVYENGRYKEVADFKDIELIQSTEVKDKDGVEIYESEIVDVRTLEGTIYLRGIVKKVNGGFCIEGLYRSKIIPLTDFYFKSYTNTLQIEVLGNKYENPYLLEE